MSTIVVRASNDLGPKINGISWALTVIAGVFLGARLYVRITQSRLWWDDHLLSASWLLLLVQACISTYAVSLGFGKHENTVSVKNLLILVKLVSIAGVFTLVAAACSKTSFALTLLKLTHGRLKIGVWAIIVTLNAVLFVNTILPFLRCFPIEAAWNPYVVGKCFDINITIRFSIFAAAYSAAMDWLLAFVPWFIIMTLNMKTKEKIGVAICMSLGFIAGATSIVRCIKIPLLQSDDFTYRAGQLAVWTVAEISTTIMATSIPILRVFLTKMVHGRPGNSGGINPYHRSAADGTFLKSLRSAKGAEHTTTITSDARTEEHSCANGTGRRSSRRNRSVAHRSNDTDGRIIKVETVAIDYGKRASGETETGTSTLMNYWSNARSSIELNPMPQLDTNDLTLNRR